MNKVHRIIWNEALQMWMAVAENAKGHSKSSRSVASAKRRLKLAALAAALATGSAGLQMAYAGPAGGQVTAGVGSIAQTGPSGATTTTINQSTQNLSLDWKSFNVGIRETVNFVQPSATALAVNKIFDTNGSQILGNLNANGQVFLINPNGVIFGAGAQVNVGGLVASTLDISSSTGSSASFAGNSTGSVINLGKITAANGGYVALLGNHVSNQGVISAQLGTVALGAGSAITLSFNGSNLVRMVVDQSVLNTLADNGGLIQADGGKVLMTAGAAKSLLASVVNNTGVIEARTVNQQGGTITLLGGMQNGTVNVAGTLDASAPSALNGQGGNGGFIETSAANVQVANSAKVTTAAAQGLAGTWLIDPTDFTISEGSDALTTSGIGASILGTSLGLGNVNIATSSTDNGDDLGDINVNAPVTWSAHQLTLTAHNNININANLNGSGTASLALQYGQGAVAAGNNSTYNLNNGAQVNLPAGPNFSTKLGSDGAITNYTVITSLGAAGSTTTTDLQGLNGGLSGNYALGGNIDASSTSAWNTGAGFTPIGNDATSFAGKFDGLGHTISGLTINLPTQEKVGLFGQTSASAVLQNIGLVSGSVTGSRYVGGLVGFNEAKISNSYATGSVNGSRYVGGLVGSNYGKISNSYVTGSVTGSGPGNYVGGLVGYNDANISNSYATGSVTGSGNNVGGLLGYNSSGTISNSYATGSVTGSGSGSDYVGGLVGYNYGTISNSYATGSVNGSGSDVGGLVGYNGNGSITNSYATGSVTGSSYVGGLVGYDYGSISNSYATGNVSGSGNSIGGLVGYNYSVSISNSYATGSVNGNNKVGGLVGYNYGSVSNSYATGSVTGSGNYVGGLLGDNYSSVSNSYATGSVNGSGNDVGGLVGYNYSVSISNSYATGSVNGSGNVGGLVGYNYGSISNGYATGSVNGSGNVGGLVGYNYGSISNGYWNTTNNPTLPGVGGGTGSQSSVNGLTTQDMQTASNFAGFTFTTTPGDAGWVIVNKDGTLNNAGGATGATSPMLATEYSTTINNAHQLQLMAMDRAASYSLGANINAAATAGGDVWGRVSAGFTPTFAPVGKETTPFSGNFDGLGHTISGLTINLPSEDNVALFGRTSAGSVIQNVGLVGGSVSGRSYVGVLVGRNYDGTISNSYATGSVTGSSGQVGGLAGSNNGTISNSYATGSVTGSGSDYVGGLVGDNNGTVSNSYATGSVSGSSYVGGLVGYNDSGITISNSYATGIVTGSSYVGGLVGRNYGTVSNSYATGSVNGSNYVGGLVGYNNGTISNSYATGSVSGSSYAGGLVGYNDDTISNSYATGSVSGSTSVGGLVGTNDGTISNSYATGSVSGSTSVGGLVGYNYDTVTNGYWNTTNNPTLSGVGDGTSSGATGLTTQEMQTASNFAGFIFTTTPGDAGWVIVNKNGTLNNAGGATGATSPMLASEYSTSIVNAHQLQLMAMAPAASYTLGANINAAATAGGDVWGSVAAGFVPTFAPVGNATTPFAGTFDGLGHTISGLTINLPSENNVGLFGKTSAAAVIQNVGLVGGSVTGSYAVGGLVGWGKGTINNSYATDSVSGSSYVGGLLGANYGTVSNSYATGSVSGSSYVGGLLGANYGTVSNSYATGSVTSSGSNVGGLVGYNSGSISNSYWNTSTTGQSSSAGGTGLTSAEMMQASRFASWNISKTGGSGAVWRIYEGHTAPLLRSFLTPLTLSDAQDVSGTYNGSAQSGATTASGLVLGAAATGTNAGFYNGYYSTQQGYDITGGNLTITGASLSAISMSGTRAYDGTADVAASIFTLTGLVGTEDLVLSGKGTISSKNVGTYESVGLGTLALGNGSTGLASNYTFTGGTRTAIITQADLNVSGLSASGKVYNALTNATLTGIAAVTALGSDDVTLDGTAVGTFASKNVGSRAVTVSGLTLIGEDAGNYNLVQQTGLSALITKADLNVTGLSASNKVFNGLTAATLTGTAAVTALESDVVTLSGTAVGTFASKAVGLRAVTVTGKTLSGEDAGNYNLVQPTGLSANITAFTLRSAIQQLTENFRKFWRPR
jgi:filamentous hemagglutinin family protein